MGKRSKIYIKKIKTMNIILNTNVVEFIPTLRVMEFRPLASQKDFLEKVREKGYVCVKASNHTKTRISTSLYIAGFNFKINWDMDGFLTHHEQEVSMWSNNVVDNYYFKKLKKQDRDCYIQYVEAIVRKTIGTGLTIKFFNNHTLRTI